MGGEKHLFLSWQIGKLICCFVLEVEYLTGIYHYSLRASSPIWANETSLARTSERAARPRGAPRLRVLARLASLAQIGVFARRLFYS